MTFALAGTLPATQGEWLRSLSSYQDVLDAAVSVGSDEQDAIREATALHAMNHVAKCVPLATNRTLSHPDLLLSPTELGLES